MNVSDNERPAIIDGVSLKVLPTPRVDLKTIDDVRVEMARVYRDMRSGRIDKSEGTKLAFVLAQLGRLIEAGELERRLVLLERR